MLGEKKVFLDVETAGELLPSPSMYFLWDTIGEGNGVADEEECEVLSEALCVESWWGGGWEPTDIATKTQQTKLNVAYEIFQH